MKSHWIWFFYMEFCVLGSGSKGNSVLVASGDTVVVIDAGFSGVDLQQRIACVGYQPEQISAVLVTHEHLDHVRGVGVISRRFKLPVYANSKTYAAAEKKIGKLAVRCEFEAGTGFEIGELGIHPFCLSHDAADPVGFLLTDGRVSLGYCTDIGKVTNLVAHHLRSCQGLVLEANHDPEMLLNGPYPMFLKQRIRSGQGHLANEDAGAFLAQLSKGDMLQHVVLAHLSDSNNDPHLALSTVRKFLDSHSEIQVAVARQDKPGDLINLS
ncbi:MAG: MBL fold metallo-hydrolase [Desulfobulbaceae bacterium]|nr:MBL fold metallo-hydrolase [Desulfobulbaceae bacterium]